MSFAATDYSITLKDVRQIYITNHTKKDLKGFKLYYYFNSQPVKDVKEFKEKITRYVANTSTSGKYVSESALQNIMNGSDFTVYNVIKWTGAKLSKSAADVAESPISADQPLVIAAPLAPAIKGLDRSAVAVELKSEGKVKVSIVNVNGSVIANIAQESLQPGIHQIKWNSGMVPSGRYIVKIEQNGMVNAKNVILK